MAGPSKILAETPVLRATTAKLIKNHKQKVESLNIRFVRIGIIKALCYNHRYVILQLFAHSARKSVTI